MEIRIDPDQPRLPTWAFVVAMVCWTFLVLCFCISTAFYFADHPLPRIIVIW